MAWEIPGFSFSLPSDQDMTNYQFVPVTAGTAANTQGYGQGGAAVTIAATGTNNVCGIVQNNPQLGEAATIVQTGISRCKAAGTIPINSLVGAGTNGAIVAAAGKQVIGRALESAVAGDTFALLLGATGVQP